MKESLKDTILRSVDDLDIFYKYLGGEIPLGKAIKSPIRDEKNPSFNIYRAKNGRIYYNDFAGSRGDCFDFVKNIYGVSFPDAVKIIAGDFGITSRSRIKRKRIKKIPKLILQKRKEVSYIERAGDPYEFDYWNQYGIFKHHLDSYLIKRAKSVQFGTYEDSENPYVLEHQFGDPLYVIPYDDSGKPDTPCKT
jgi:hypothetical protein